MLEHLIMPWNLNTKNSKIWFSREWKELLKWNKKHFSKFRKWSLLDLKNKWQKFNGHILENAWNISFEGFYVFNQIYVWAVVLKRVILFKENTCLRKHFFSVYLHSLFDKIFQNEDWRTIFRSLSLSDVW